MQVTVNAVEAKESSRELCRRPAASHTAQVYEDRADMALARCLKALEVQTSENSTQAAAAAHFG
jgi:hypothetical protein